MEDLTVLSHVGIVVPDLEGACADLTEALGVSWAPVAEQLVVARGEQGVTETPTRLTWSRQGPPYLEVIQAVDGTPWKANGARQLHHVGYWVDDVAAATSRLLDTGLALELVGVEPPGEDPTDFAYLIGEGLRVELLDSRRRRLLERWLEAG